MAWGTGVHKNARLDEVRVGRFRVFNCRQRPTLPHSSPCSTIGGIRLNFRVRNGNGCDPDPMTTGKLIWPSRPQPSVSERLTDHPAALTPNWSLGSLLRSRCELRWASFFRLPSKRRE